MKKIKVDKKKVQKLKDKELPTYKQIKEEEKLIIKGLNKIKKLFKKKKVHQEEAIKSSHKYRVESEENE